MKKFVNTKAAEINETELGQASGGAIIYKDGYYELVSGTDIVGRYAYYEDALYVAQYYGYGTRYYSSETEYLNANFPRTSYVYYYQPTHQCGGLQDVPNYHPATVQGW